MTRRGFVWGNVVAAGFGSAGAAFQEPAKKIRMGVVGGGFGASFHWHEHPGCTIAAVTDLRADRRDRLRKAYRCDNVYHSLEDMLAREKNLDAVAVFTGATSHYKHVEMCMNRGLHVQSACPAVSTLEQAEKLKALKEKTGLRYMMAESSYYRGAAIYARNLYRQGAFGQIFYTESEYYHDRGDLQALITDKKSRFFEPDGSHSWRWGQPPMFYPTHSLCYTVGVTGERITNLSCLGWSQDHPWTNKNEYRNPHWNQSALMRTSGGNIVRCNVFFLVAGAGERAQWFGEHGTLAMANQDVHGDDWRLRMGGKQPLTIPEYWRKDPMLPPAMRHNSGHGGSAVFLCAEFINALLQNREPAVDVYESLAMTVPGLVAHQSALKNGEQLGVPRFERSNRL
ncbi:MAG TPA: Gfo/Idh/MocA family oxidoreductase [Bryobacteraceae bacterium]|nr:Gfo/Idh/MocA family oxidoreductase [Bryobacteraceae bacterium]